MTHINILLENNNHAVFFPGQVLKGTIELHLDEQKKVNGLYFVINGRAKCHWTETERRTVGHGDNRRTESHTVHYEGKEIYMNSRVYLFGHQGGQSVQMPAGTHRYTFETLLPPMIPASFEASHGNIRYNVEACLDIPWRFDKEFKLQISVVRNEDLNMYPELRIPCRNERVKSFCCLFCKSEPLMVTATIPCGGFTPGSVIPITIEYNNKSDVRVDRTKINLKRIVKFNSQTPYHKSKFQVEKMVEVFKEGVGSSTVKSIVENLKIPSILVPTNNRICNVVQISYDLKVEAEVSGCHKNLEMVFPIVIGTVPIDFNQTTPYGQFTNGVTQISPYDPVNPVPYNPGNQPYNPGNPLPYNPSVPMPTAPMNQNDFSNPMADLPPSFDEAVKMNVEKNESSNMIQPQSGLGWNVQQPPSAPAEK